MNISLICNGCARGCHLTAEVSGDQVLSVEGHTCKHGKSFAETVLSAPATVLTASVPVAGGGVLAVHTSGEVPRELLPACMEAIHTCVAGEHTRAGDVLCANIGGSGADLIADWDACYDEDDYGDY